MDDNRAVRGNPFVQRRKSAIDAIIEKYSKETFEEDDVIDVLEGCFVEERGWLAKHTSESKFSEALADFILNSDVEWSSSSSTLASSPSCEAASHVLRQSSLPPTDVGETLSSSVADEQPSESKSDAVVVVCSSEVSATSSDCYITYSSRSVAASRVHDDLPRSSPLNQSATSRRSPAKIFPFPETPPASEQSRRRGLLESQWPVGKQSNPYYFPSVATEKLSIGHCFPGQQQGNSSSCAPATAVSSDDIGDQTVEHKTKEGSSRSGVRRQAASTNARLSLPLRQTVSSGIESADGHTRAQPRGNVTDDRSSTARASHVTLRSQFSDRPPLNPAEHATASGAGNESDFTVADGRNLNSSLPSGREVRRPKWLPAPAQNVCLRSRKQSSPRRAGSAALDQPQLSACATGAHPEDRQPGLLTPKNLTSLGKFKRGEWTAIYLKLVQSVDCRSSLPFAPSLQLTAFAANHLYDCHSVNGSEALAARLSSSDDVLAAAGSGFIECQPISVRAGLTGATAVSGSRTNHPRSLHIVDRELRCSSASCYAGDSRAGRVTGVLPTTQAKVLSPISSSSASSPTAVGDQPCRFTHTNMPRLPASADDGSDRLVALDHVRHHRKSYSVRRYTGFKSAVDDNIVDLNKPLPSACWDEVQLAVQAAPTLSHGNRSQILKRDGGRIAPGVNRCRLADNQTDLNGAHVAPGPVETFSQQGLSSPYVSPSRSSCDTACSPLSAFSVLEPPPGWRTGDNTPTDQAVGPYTPPNDFAAPRAVHTPVSAAALSGRVSRYTTFNTESIAQQHHELVRPGQRPHQSFASPAVLELKVWPRHTPMLPMASGFGSSAAVVPLPPPPPPIMSPRGWTQPTTGRSDGCCCSCCSCCCGPQTPVSYFVDSAECRRACCSDCA